MAAELPDVACPTNRYPSRRVDFVVGLPGIGVVKVLQRQINFGQAESRDRQVEVDVELFQLQKTLAE